LAQNKAAQGFSPQSQQCCVEDGNPRRTPVWAKICHLWMDTSYYILHLVALLVPLSFLACATTDRVLLGPEEAQVLASLEHAKDNIETFKGIGQLKISAGKGVQTARVAWIGSRPCNLRLETLGVWGRPSLLFLLKDDIFYVHDINNNRYFKGKNSVRNLRRFLSVPVEPQDLYSILSGSPPIVSFYEAKIEVLPDKSQSCLFLYKRWNRIAEKICFGDDLKTVKEVELFDPRGDSKYVVKFSRFRDVNGSLIPYRIRVLHENEIDMLLDVSRFYIQVPIPKEAFTLGLPDDQAVDLED